MKKQVSVLNIRFHSMFDVQRSMLDVHLFEIIIEDPVFFLRMIPAEPIISDHAQGTWVSKAN